MRRISYIKGISSNRSSDRNNITSWIHEDDNGNKQVAFCYLAYVTNINDLKKKDSIKKNFDEDAIDQYIELQMSLNEKGKVIEVLVLLQEKYEEDAWSDSAIIGKQQHNLDNIIGHSLLAHDEYRRLETLARTSFLVLKGSVDWNVESSCEWIN